MEVLITGKENYSQIFKDFMDKHGLHKIIAFSGGSDDKLSGVPDNDSLQEQFKSFRQNFDSRIVTDALQKLQGYQVAILTGGTKWGVPKIACEVSKEFGFKTIGIYPLTGKKYSMNDDFLDLRLCVEPLIGESRWGDEGPLWTSIVDGIFVIGGGAGTLTECAHVQKINEAIVKHGGTPKFIVPIHGTGGVAEELPHLWAKLDIRAVSMPDRRVTSGQEAARILIEKLNLDDYYDHHTLTRGGEN